MNAQKIEARRAKENRDEVHAAAGLRWSRKRGSRPDEHLDAGEIEAHIAYQVELNEELSERGELVEAQALTAPEQAKFVVHDGAGAPVITDGPFPEGKELLAGYRIVDVESPERAVEIAARGSAAPGPALR